MSKAQAALDYAQANFLVVLCGLLVVGGIAWAIWRWRTSRWAQEEND